MFSDETIKSIKESLKAGFSNDSPFLRTTRLLLAKCLGLRHEPEFPTGLKEDASIVGYLQRTSTLYVYAHVGRTNPLHTTAYSRM
jgi:hypothetical protein